MENKNMPAYPFIAGDQSNPDDRALCEGLTKKEKLAMEIYVARMPALINNITTAEFEMEALASLRAADIFFEQLNK